MKKRSPANAGTATRRGGNRSRLRSSSRQTSMRVSARRSSAPKLRSGSAAKTKGGSTATRSQRGKTAQRAKGGKRAGSRAMSGSAQMTTDHDEIRRWVEERGGTPATVSRTVRDSQDAGILRIDFPGYSGKGSLRSVSWDEWFEVFDERNLAFLHQDKTANGKLSRFNKVVCRT